MITREQVADLQPGDVVELTANDDALTPTTVRGRCVGYRREDDLGLTIGPGLVLRRTDGLPAVFWTEEAWNLTVVSRAPRPLYVNHARTEPAAGDVAIPVDHAPDDLVTWSYVERNASRGFRWRSTESDAWIHREEFESYYLRLLVDGETGQVVP